MDFFFAISFSKINQIFLIKLQSLLKQFLKILQSTIDDITKKQERLAIFLSGRLEAEKISPNPRRRAIRRAHNTQTNNNPVAAIVGRNQQQAGIVNGGY